jgi:hypothetical protein
MEGPLFKPAGEPVAVDTSLIDEMLRLSPAERLRQNDRMAALAAKLQGAFSAHQREWQNRET